MLLCPFSANVQYVAQPGKHEHQKVYGKNTILTCVTVWEKYPELLLK